ncbi:hypothetical protein QC764_607500 [Podospora pseudoanserina]|uniref:Heterokaryon incompatibility domain-containing protein n=1 Tax=Podospora pseudoanserina TaxID=2609844 RepID=A0ABR0HUS9_9PEZI|nr:hypothetical protein QC764_607500 [Podospora pseudoanserina]
MHTSRDYRLLSYSLAVNYNGLWRNYLRCSRASGLFLIIGDVCNVCSPTLAPKRCLTIWNKRHLPSNSSSSRATGRVPTKLRHQKLQIAVRGPNMSRQHGPQEEATRNDPAPKDSQLTQHGTITRYRDRADAPVHGRLEQEYPYASLTKVGNIHLLHLIPSREHDGRIEARLVEYPLLQVTQVMHLYEALSYSWVTCDFSRSIYIDGLELLVTHNLHEALLCLRDPEIVRVLWIDVICISQINDTEKQGQIPLIPRIYSMANRVIQGNWLAACALVDALSDPLEYYDASEILQKLLHYENWTAQYWQFRPHYLGSGDEGEDYVREYSSTERQRWLSKPQDVGFVAHTTNRAVDKLLEVFSARRARVTPHRRSTLLPNDFPSTS